MACLVLCFEKLSVASEWRVDWIVGAAGWGGAHRVTQHEGRGLGPGEQWVN